MKTALLISVQGIGNTVLMTPAIAALSSAEYTIDTVISNNGSHEILRLCPGVRRQYEWNERASALTNLSQLAGKLRRERYDVACALYPNGRRENSLLWLCRADRKIRYRHQNRRVRLADFLPAGEKLRLPAAHDVTNNLRLIQTFMPQTEFSKPSLEVSPEGSAFANDFFSRCGLSNRFVIAIQPGGGGIAKRWSETNYVDLCNRLRKDDSVRFLICGSESETELVKRITQGIGARATSVGGVPIDKVAALIANCRLLIANDSALPHIASALEVPVVVVWGYTDFRRVAPVNENGILIRINYPCNPCYEFANGYIEDCQYHLKCIKEISVDHVYRIVSRYVGAIQRQLGSQLELLNANDDFGSERLETGCTKIDLPPTTAPAVLHV